MTQEQVELSQKLENAYQAVQDHTILTPDEHLMYSQAKRALEAGVVNAVQLTINDFLDILQEPSNN